MLNDLTSQVAAGIEWHGTKMCHHHVDNMFPICSGIPQDNGRARSFWEANMMINQELDEQENKNQQRSVLLAQDWMPQR